MDSVALILNSSPPDGIRGEDVDAVVPDHKTKPKVTLQTPDSGDTAQTQSEGVTLSGLLNCMDGITAPDGAIIVMTTNHPELIDSALLRPGRVDIRVDFTTATREQIQRMLARLKPNGNMDDEIDFMLERHLTTAQVQSEMLKHTKGVLKQ